MTVEIDEIAVRRIPTISHVVMRRWGFLIMSGVLR